jgi:hypothetical protein
MNHDFAVMRLNADGKLRPVSSTRAAKESSTTDFGGNVAMKSDTAVAIQPTAGSSWSAFACTIPTQNRPFRSVRAGSLQPRRLAGQNVLLRRKTDGPFAPRLPAGAKPCRLGEPEHRQDRRRRPQNIRSGEDSDYASCNYTATGPRLVVRRLMEKKKPGSPSKTATSKSRRQRVARRQLLAGARESHQFGIWRFNANGEFRHRSAAAAMTFHQREETPTQRAGDRPETKQVAAVETRTAC